MVVVLGLSAALPFSHFLQAASGGLLLLGVAWGLAKVLAPSARRQLAPAGAPLPPGRPQLRKSLFAPPDPVKYPNPLDESFEDLCLRTGWRPPESGEDPITWALYPDGKPEKLEIPRQD